MSYPKGKTSVTCYAYEPWHYRYVGRTRAAKIRASGLTLREYLWREQNTPAATPNRRPTPTPPPTPTPTPTPRPIPTPTPTPDPDAGTDADPDAALRNRRRPRPVPAAGGPVYEASVGDRPQAPVSTS